MTPLIAVCFMTCGRVDYTRRTLESFSAQHPDQSRWLLLHGDDGSTEPEIGDLARAHGFETVVQHRTRRGARAMRTELVNVAASRGARWILLLENDWEWVRPFPFALFTQLAETRPDVYSLRLYGDFKGRHRSYPCSRRNLGQPRRPPVPWWPLPGAVEPCEIGRYHWGAPPAITRVGELRKIMAWAGGFQDRGDAAEVRVSGRIDAYVARVTENCVYHIGDEKTQERSTTRVRMPRRPPRYTPEWQERRSWTQPHSAACFLIALNSCRRPLASLLDVGCGSGHLVRLARQKHIDAVGVDLSVPEGREGSLRHADLRQPLDLGQTFPMVLCWEVAEHLPPESADVLCDSLVAHLRPGGLLLFTAATPGQGGDGHVNEQPASYWREKFEARGLRFQVERTTLLRRQWKAVAPRTPWYGNNLQAFRKPSTAQESESETDVLAPGPVTSQPPIPLPDVHIDPTLPRVAVTMRTADRSPNPNYVGGTVKRLLRQGPIPGGLHLCATNPDTAWLAAELGDRLDQVTVHVPDRPLTPNENGLAQIRCLDPQAYDWVLLLEDDLVFCADFVGSVQRWIADHAKPSRHFYRLFGFRVFQTLSKRTGASYDATMDRCAGSQAVILRMADALDFVAWADENLERWGGFRGNARIAFDKLLASWLAARYGSEPGVMSNPMFVKHIGHVSSLHPKTAHMDQYFAGDSWRYRGEPERPRVPRLWPGETVVCIGGGTVTQADVDLCRGRARVIAINDAYKLAPWADVLYAADWPWWQVHQSKLGDFAGLRYSMEPITPSHTPRPAGVTILRNTGEHGLESDPSGLRTGFPKGCSGYQAIQLAVHFGALKVILLGYDLQKLANGKTHWFGDHPSPLTNHSPYNYQRDAFTGLVAPLETLGVSVLNASTRTSLTCFPRVSLAEALSVEAVA